MSTFTNPKTESMTVFVDYKSVMLSTCSHTNYLETTTKQVGPSDVQEILVFNKTIDETTASLLTGVYLTSDGQFVSTVEARSSTKDGADEAVTDSGQTIAPDGNTEMWKKLYNKHISACSRCTGYRPTFIAVNP